MKTLFRVFLAAAAFMLAVSVSEATYHHGVSFRSRVVVSSGNYVGYPVGVNFVNVQYAPAVAFPIAAPQLALPACPEVAAPAAAPPCREFTATPSVVAAPVYAPATVAAPVYAPTVAAQVYTPYVANFAVRNYVSSGVAVRSHVVGVVHPTKVVEVTRVRNFGRRSVAVSKTVSVGNLSVTKTKVRVRK